MNEQIKNLEIIILAIDKHAEKTEDLTFKNHLENLSWELLRMSHELQGLDLCN